MRNLKVVLAALVTCGSVIIARPAPAESDPPDEPPVRLADFVVTPSRYGIAEERVGSSVLLTRADLEPLPQVGEDLYRTICRLPGLAASDASARFLVRGAPNSQLLARLDGVDLVDPFHLKEYDGAVSIVDIETIASVDLVTGGFTVEYGDRLAGVLTMETRSEPRPGRNTTLGLSVTHMRATHQGAFAGGDGHWMLAARRGYLDLALELGGTDIEESPTFYDLSGKIEYRIGGDHRVSLHLLHAADTFKSVHKRNEPDFRSACESSYLWGRWRGRFGNRFAGEAVLAFTRSERNRNGDGFQEWNQHIRLRDDRRFDTVSLRQDWTAEIGGHALLRAGFEGSSGRARYDYALAAERWLFRDGQRFTETRTINATPEPDGHRAAGYAALRVRPLPGLVVEPGLRYERHSHTRDSGATPRVNASLALGPTTIRAAWGYVEQAQGLHELSVQDGETAFNRAERAEHRVVGVSRRFGSGLELRLEAYERLTTRVRPSGDNLIDPFDFFAEAGYDRVWIAPARGRARGVELVVQNRLNRSLSWSASYAWSKAEELVDNRWVPRNWHQEHTFHTDLTWVPARNWQLSWSWQWHSGWPYTDINYSLLTLADGTLIHTWAYGELRGLRAPAYHRLDFRATRTFRLEKGTLRAFVDILNAYDRENPIGYDEPRAWIAQGRLRVDKSPAKMLPLLPSAGVSWEF